MTASATEGPVATVFDVQRLSLDDGPGIRTAVFLKGCPLDCLWCHNPESRDPRPELRYRASLCSACGACVEACPVGAQGLGPGPEGRNVHSLDRSACIRCGACVGVCPTRALEMVGREYGVDELFAELEPDRHYYSLGEGGGVTFTGGEPLAQADFLEAFLGRKGSLHVAVETSGFAPSARVAALAPLVDLFLFDYKATGEEAHRRLCASSSSPILANLAIVCGAGPRVLLRLPLIPGINDGEEHLRAVADLMAAHPRLEGPQIMAYHDLGTSKLADFGLSSRLPATKSAGRAEVEAWLEALHGFGAPGAFCTSFAQDPPGGRRSII